MSHEVALLGCRRSPIADYLKALGVFRLIAEQFDPSARAWWSGGSLMLRSSADRDSLVEFFAARYAPTPIVAPWNGGSGFYAKDTQNGIVAIERSTTERFAAYRRAIGACRALLGSRGLVERPKGEAKQALIEALRATLDDHSLRWIDAAVALGEEGPSYSPLLGTGGNDGRLDFSNNQMQRLAETLLESDGARALLRAALFDEPAPRLLRDVAIGQFRPTSAGGANAGEGFDRVSLVNPWDYILLLEGALVFAVALSRRIEGTAPGVSSFPFTVRASGSGYGTAARDEASKTYEIWLPLWSKPASHDEVRAVFGEGRATIGRRTVRTGVDFARSIRSLGVDRGIEEFSRFGFLERNGQSCFATPLGDWSVSTVSAVRLLDDIDDWLAQVARGANGKNAPGSLRRVACRVDEAVMNVCRRGDPSTVCALLAAIGEVEAVCTRSQKAREAIRPVPALSPQWFALADDGSLEIRLAASLAAGGLRRYLAAARPRGTAHVWANDDGDRVWGERVLVDNLIAVAERRGTLGQTPALDGPVFARPSDVAMFVAGHSDDGRIESLARGLCSVQWSQTEFESGVDGPELPVLFSICRLALMRRPMPGIELPRTKGLVARLAAGDSITASRIACRRLRGVGLVARCGPIATEPQASRRVAAALLFPLSPSTLAAMRRRVIRTNSLEKLHHGSHHS